MLDRIQITNLRSPGQRGFTLVELVVASVITSVALLGVYAMFAATADVEARTTARWQRRSAARGVADHIAATLEAAANVPGLPAIAGSFNAGGGYTLEAVTQPPGGSPAPLLRRRYHWSVTLAATGTGPNTGSGPGTGIQLQVQTLLYGGTKDLTAYPAAVVPAPADAWAAVGPRTVASGLTSIEVAFRRAADPEGEWQDHYTGPAGQVAVRVIVRCDGETAERLVVPRARAELVERGTE